MECKIITQNPPLSSLELELIQMGFPLQSIQQAIKLTTDKEKLIESLLSERQAQYLQQNQESNQIMSLDKPKDKNKEEEENMMKDENEQQDDEDDFESVQEEYKMVFLARMDLKLALGKMAAQVASAALSAFKQLQAKSDTDQLAQIAYYQWLESGQKKIVVKINSQAELLDLAEVIKKEKVNIFLCRSKKEDQLEIPEGTITVAAVGPAPEDLLDKLTRHLKLY